MPTKIFIHAFNKIKQLKIKKINIFKKYIYIYLSLKLNPKAEINYTLTQHRKSLYKTNGNKTKHEPTMNCSIILYFHLFNISFILHFYYYQIENKRTQLKKNEKRIEVN